MNKKKKFPKYDFKKIEKKWQEYWLEKKTNQLDLDEAEKPFYNLMMFPYPSAEGLHVGGVSTFSGVDTFGRYKKMQGYDVFEPIGLDGFGIHSENYAMKIGQHIKDVSKRTEKNFYRQLHSIGNMHDWSRTVETYKPEYYRWTQWLFLQMYKRGLAYQKKAKVNWCPYCKTVLSDEQVIGGKCERCDSEVQKKELKQWFFKITAYAEKLLKNLDWIDWPEDVKINQRNWIGKSEGARIKFLISPFEKGGERGISEDKKILPGPPLSKEGTIEVFTTRPDTIFGATYLVIAPEHEAISDFQSSISNFEEVENYVKKALSKSDQERKADEKEKTGVELKGINAINPATKKEIPIWVADYVLGDYGTGAIMAVPAHDERDYEFAKKYGLEINPVVQEIDSKEQETRDKRQTNSKSQIEIGTCFSGEGVAIDSDFLNGLKTKEAKIEIIKWLEKNDYGQGAVDYKLRDWCISRQRYWGPPIPMVYCEKCAKKKPKILVIYGIYGHPKENWFPWFKREMERRGYEVMIPDLPNPEKPELNEWLEVLKKEGIKKGDRLSIVAHSLGAPVACQFILKNKLNIDKLILVAPTGKSQGEENWNNLKKAGCNQEGIDCIKNFNEANQSLKTLKNYTGESVLYLSDNDPYIPLNVYDDYKELEARKIIFKNKGHFNESAGVLKLPEILDEFPENVNAGWYPVPEDDLPVVLPPMKDFLPEGKGKGPLAKNKKFVETKCPVCGGPAERETDVSDPFVDSCWYFFRYPSTEFNDRPLDERRTKKWLPVDSYIGGKEHTVLHLLYSRFVTMVFKDMGLINFEEPYKRFFGHGLITKDGAKMSKSKGNVVNPDDMIEKYGADTLRLYLRFLGDFSQGGDWRDGGIEGMSKFIRRMWTTFFELEGAGNGVKKMNMLDKTVKSIGDDIEKLSFNTAVARLMEFVNWIKENEKDFDTEQAEKVKETLALVVAPMAPHIAEEFWESLSSVKGSIFNQAWPKYDAKNLVEDEIELVLQVNGKVRDRVNVSRTISKEEAEKIALENEKMKKFTEGKKIIKVVFVPGRLVNVVAK